MQIIQFFSILLSFSAMASENLPSELGTYAVDSEKTINGVTLKSGKKDDVRFFYSTVSRTYQADMATTESLVTNFEEKCNNQHQMRRLYLAKDYKCPFLNKNLVESSIVKKLKIPAVAGVDESWVVRRHIFNRGTYSHNDLVTIKRTPGVKTIVEHTMLSEEEAKKYIDDPIEHREPFIYIRGSYILEPISAKETKVTYDYQSRTDHMILNKSISVGNVFDSIVDGTTQALQTIQDGLALKKLDRVGQN